MRRVIVAAVALFLGTADLVAQPLNESNAIHALLVAGNLPQGKALEFPLLRVFYEQRSFRPAWSGTPLALREARQMMAALARADEEGLDPRAYHAADISLQATHLAPVDAAQYDILLSDGALRYARDLRIGRADLKMLDADVDLPQQSFDVVSALNAALANDSVGTFLADLPPPHPEYVRLEKALARYREIALRGGWPTLPEPFPADPSATADVGLLRQRLAFEDVDAESASLAEAIMRFQERHGLAADGSVGPQTLRALNVSATERAAQIAANMERWRWLPRNFETDHVTVNVPDQRLTIVGPNGPVLTSRVVVGKPASPTPLLRAVATSVTINPPWNVPDDIARREILPKLHANPDYLLSEHMILRDGPRGDPFGQHIDWEFVPASKFHYHLQQQPGPKNALGTVKLELPNRFDVYLHYTSAEAAFALDTRDLSHGCVRVEQILPLASYALARDPSSAIASLQAAIASGETQHLSLNKPLPIYLLYWTAFVDADGSMEFRPDIYGRDARLIAAQGAGVAGTRVSLTQADCAPA